MEGRLVGCGMTVRIEKGYGNVVLSEYSDALNGAILPRTSAELRLCHGGVKWERVCDGRRRLSLDAIE